MNGIAERSLHGAALALVLLLACGCGKKMMAKVEGTVLLDGKPLDGATVVFQPEQGGLPASGLTGSDGVFHLTTRSTGDGAREGNYKVTITKQKKSVEIETPAKSGDTEHIKDAWKKYRAKPAADSSKDSALPAEYSDAGKTPLRCQVPPEGPLEFKLRSKGGS